jgi:hypothetical protein
MATKCCTCMAWGIAPPHTSVVVLTAWACDVCHGPRSSRSRGEVMRGGDLSCEAETCRARRRLVMRGGDFSCEAETCHGDPFCRETVGDVANWSETGHLASVGLDRGLQSSSSRILALTSSILAFTLVLGYLVFEEDHFAVKWDHNPGPCHYDCLRLEVSFCIEICDEVIATSGMFDGCQYFI